MHEGTAGRISALAGIAESLGTGIREAIDASAPVIAAYGAAASQIRAESQRGAMAEDDEPSIRNAFEILQRTSARLEEFSRQAADMNQSLVNHARQLARDIANLQTLLDAVQNPPAPSPDPE